MSNEGTLIVKGWDGLPRVSDERGPVWLATVRKPIAPCESCGARVVRGNGNHPCAYCGNPLAPWVPA